MYVLALLHLSSAFETIGQYILVHRFNTDITFTDTVLQWFSSYQTDHTHSVTLSNLFSMYIRPMSAIIDSHTIMHNSFADDLQLLMSSPSAKSRVYVHMAVRSIDASLDAKIGDTHFFHYVRLNIST